MTPVDDLKVGMWIAVVGCRDEETQSEMPFFGCPPKHQHFDGTPMKIMAISLPFLAVQHRNGCGTIDVRRFMVRAVSRKYVNCWLEAPAPLPRSARRKKKAKPEKGSCPRCGCRMVQRSIIHPTKKGWFTVCPICGYDAGPVGKDSPS